MKLWTKLLFILFIFSLFLQPLKVEARSGCCSHHDGVCGCECCDGTALSSTCAPYYPECNSIPIIIQPTSVPKPTIIPTKKPTLVPTKVSTPTPKPTTIEEISPTTQPPVLNETDIKKPTEPTKTSDTILGFSILGLIGFGVYKLFIKIRNKIKEIFSKK